MPTTRQILAERTKAANVLNGTYPGSGGASVGWTNDTNLDQLINQRCNDVECDKLISVQLGRRRRAAALDHDLLSNHYESPQTLRQVTSQPHSRAGRNNTLADQHRTPPTTGPNVSAAALLRTS
ncbi:hypothetical protein A8144_14170 [Mycobacterium leprae 3125609]|uniref:Uncharacterized protein MLCB2492.13c n=1 Tax=Mycobacterium leprae TaxID=1769 RepID=O32992_MYCLR|nr:hypothetical protein A8144_13985 [Mycobacterium leprae 3125609]OAX70099.1 hypothetical protein A3216_14010 [Mycobacterium leprae 7935681]CAB11445.1 hypothetical protein [Mycobacterium leprae]OAR20534.1 hypothetical protein A8144_02670 [Mycobacterium leprae 3125609]OAR20688.1 hypothetical protein A8144_09870 [Mycobacterium leprae 3125609]